MQKQYDCAVFIGRANPFHNAHLHNLREAFRVADQVVMIHGSALAPRNERNFFLTHEVEAMVRGALTEEELSRFHFKPVRDVLYNETKWLNDVRAQVASVSMGSIVLVGHEKDGSSYYLKKFPDWASHAVKSIDGNLSATDLRNSIMRLPSDEIHTDGWEWQKDKVPQSTFDIVNAFIGSPEYDELMHDIDYCVRYRTAHADASRLIAMKLGYRASIKLVTADSCVIHAGHVLLIRRKSSPGKGLWALPGGFLDDKDNSLLDAALRELKEETRIKLPVPVLKGSLIRTKEYADPHRSSRGRIVTHAHLFLLNEDMPRPDVKPRDDAIEAKWVPLNELDSRVMFEDHYPMIQNLTSIL